MKKKEFSNKLKLKKVEIANFKQENIIGGTDFSVRKGCATFWFACSLIACHTELVCYHTQECPPSNTATLSE